MENQLFETALNELLDPEIGKELTLTGEDRMFIEKFNESIKPYNEDVKPLLFRNYIRSFDRCGFASSGLKQELINTDTQFRYRVTVRTNWRSGIHQGEFDRVFVINAGSKIYLGCTRSGSIPVASYSRRVVGEQRL